MTSTQLHVRYLLGAAMSTSDKVCTLERKAPTEGEKEGDSKEANAQAQHNLHDTEGENSHFPTVHFTNKKVRTVTCEENIVDLET